MTFTTYDMQMEYAHNQRQGKEKKKLDEGNFKTPFFPYSDANHTASASPRPLGRRKQNIDQITNKHPQHNHKNMKRISQGLLLQQVIFQLNV